MMVEAPAPAAGDRNRTLPLSLFEIRDSLFEIRDSRFEIACSLNNNNRGGSTKGRVVPVPVPHFASVSSTSQYLTQTKTQNFKT